jgi:hypothetical protein
MLRDLTDELPGDVAAERARVAVEGWGARLLALRGGDGQWSGGACFPSTAPFRHVPRADRHLTRPRLVHLELTHADTGI